MRLVKLSNQVTGRTLNSNWARQAHARAMYPTSLFKQRRLSGLTQSGCVLWGIAYGNIMLWDGHTWRYIRKQHLVWRNQLHNVYNVDRCIANSNILYVTCSFFFWSYRISTISHRILVLVSFLACLLTKTPQPHHESPGPWRVLTYFAIDREFKHCWLIVIHSFHSRRVAKRTLRFTVCQWKSQKHPQGIREDRLQAKSNMMFSVVDGDLSYSNIWTEWTCRESRWYQYQSAQACVVISLSGINKSPIPICQILVGRQVMRKTAT